MTQIQHPWLHLLEPHEKVTTHTPYEEGRYLSLFEPKLFDTNDPAIGNLRYYVFDPTRHGFSADGCYPVLVMLHGSGASLRGITAVNWAAAESFASPEYQQRMGGAYIIVPLANEWLGEDGEERMSWMTPAAGKSADAGTWDESTLAAIREYLGKDAAYVMELLGANSVYTDSLIRLIETEKAAFTSAGKTLVFGTSAGGYCAWRLILSMPVDGAMIMAGAYIPSEQELNRLDRQSLPLWICHGVHDECVPYDLMIRPILPQLQQMKHVSLYLPEWVRMPDGAVYSIPAGFEMGQHCINNAVQCDLMYADGTPMDPGHPRGVTGWVREMAGKV